MTKDNITENKNVAEGAESRDVIDGSDKGDALMTPDALDPMVQVRDVSKVYSDDQGAETHALRNITLDVPDGEFVGVVGPSGCGKSTLMLIIAGLIQASSGNITVDGEPVDGPRPDDISVVFQEYTLLPWKTTLENVAFPLALRGVDADERRGQARDLVELVGLEGFENSHPHELSGGMKQRVAIARGLIQDPELLLMDEPFGALDEQTRMQMGNEVLRIWNESEKTVVFITHDLGEAVYLSDRVIVLTEGEAIEQIEVNLPRPRTMETMETEAFGQLRNRLWKLIMEES